MKRSRSPVCIAPTDSKYQKGAAEDSQTPEWLGDLHNTTSTNINAKIQGDRDAKVAILRLEYDTRVKEMRQETEEQVHRLRQQVDLEVVQLHQVLEEKVASEGLLAEEKFAAVRRGFTREAFAALVDPRRRVGGDSSGGIPSPSVETDHLKHGSAISETGQSSTSMDGPRNPQIPLASAENLRRRSSNNVFTVTGSTSRSKTYSDQPMRAKEKEWLRCILRCFKLSDGYKEFLQPVDWKALGINDYPTIVPKDKRMDLSTMETKLDGNKYLSVQAFADDVKLIVDASCEYNGGNHPISQAAVAMLKEFQDAMKKCPK